MKPSKLLPLIERLKVRLSIKLFWWQPEKKAQVIATFHATEADSAWQLAHIFPRVSGKKERNEVFQHILEEMVHADLFRIQAAKLSNRQFIAPAGERHSLYAKAEPVWKFFVYCIIGEKSALDRFSNVAVALPEGELRRTFVRVLRDEAGHVHNAKDLAQVLAPSPAKIRQELTAVRIRRFRDGWMRQGQLITDILANIFLGLLYFMIAPFGYIAARNKILGLPDRSIQLSRTAHKPTKKVRLV